MAFCSSKLLAKAPYTILSHGYVCSVGHTNAAPRWPCLWGGLAHPIAASPPLQRTPPVRGGLERQTQVTKIDDHFFMTSPFLFNCSPSSMMVKLITCEFSLTFHIPFFPLVLKYQLLYLKCVWAAQSCLTLWDPVDPLPMEFSWNGLPCPPPRNLPDPRIEAGVPHCRQIL